MDAVQVVPNLWIGSQPPLFLEPRWDHLVLCAIEYQPSSEAFPGMRVWHCPLDDSGAKMMPIEKDLALEASRIVAEQVWLGQRVLVTCMQGRNRSGLVVALSLMRLGYSPRAAISTLLRVRPTALTNPEFVGFIQQLHGRPSRRPAPLASAEA